MIDVQKYRLVYLLKFAFLVLAVFLMSILTLGMTVHKSLPWQIMAVWGVLLFELIMLSLPLFRNVRENVKLKPVFGINLLLLLFNTMIMIEYAVTSDFEIMKGVFYSLFLYINYCLFRSNFQLVRNKSLK